MITLAALGAAMDAANVVSWPQLLGVVLLVVLPVGGTFVAMMVTLGRLTERVHELETTISRHDQHWLQFNQRWGELPAKFANAAELAVTLERLETGIAELRAELCEHLENPER